MDNKTRTIMFVDFVKVILGLIFLTPYGFVWAMVVYGMLAVICALTDWEINFVLWGFLWLLLSISCFWFYFLKHNGLPQNYFQRIKRRE